MSRTILIVNGSTGRRQSRRELLERAGYEVRETLSIDTAIEVARQHRPLAVVIEPSDDVGISGTFTESLRLHAEAQGVPVLVLSAEPPEPHEEIAGVSWLPDPCPPRTLLDEIAYLTRPPKVVGPASGEVPKAPEG